MYSSSSSSSREMEEGIVSVIWPAVDAAPKSPSPTLSSGLAAARSAPPEETSAADQDSSSTDQHGANMIVKGKRTKRPRTTSAAAPQHHQSTAASSTSNSSSGGSRKSSGITEEEEDMANCLILLAQSDPHAGPVSSSNKHEEKGGGNKASSGSLAEASVSAAGYECKTCRRCFPTFQALGGHRASHKKPKMSVVEPSTYAGAGHMDSEEKTMILDQGLIDHHHRVPRQSSLLWDSTPTLIMPPTATIRSILNNDNIITATSLTNNNNSSTKSTTARVHECSICGSEFQSGQALGGHMRRHRAPTTAAALTSSTPLVGSPLQLSADNPPNNTQDVMMKSVVLPLDLNLPAPSEEAEFLKATPPPPAAAFPFSPPSKRPTMLLSTSPLVDCHY